MYSSELYLCGEQNFFLVDGLMKTYVKKSRYLDNCKMIYYKCFMHLSSPNCILFILKRFDELLDSERDRRDV